MTLLVFSFPTPKQSVLPGMHMSEFASRRQELMELRYIYISHPSTVLYTCDPLPRLLYYLFTGN